MDQTGKIKRLKARLFASELTNTRDLYHPLPAIVITMLCSFQVRGSPENEQQHGQLRNPKRGMVSSFYVHASLRVLSGRAKVGPTLVFAKLVLVGSRETKNEVNTNKNYKAIIMIVSLPEWIGQKQKLDLFFATKMVQTKPSC